MLFEINEEIPLIRCIAFGIIKQKILKKPFIIGDIILDKFKCMGNLRSRCSMLLKTGQ